MTDSDYSHRKARELEDAIYPLVDAEIAKYQRGTLTSAELANNIAQIRQAYTEAGKETT